MLIAKGDKLPMVNTSVTDILIKVFLEGHFVKLSVSLTTLVLHPYLTFTEGVFRLARAVVVNIGVMTAGPPI